MDKSSSGEVGPVIGVLVVIAVLGILAGLVGRLCSGRTIMGYGPRIDAEAWLESKFSTCLDGHPPPPRRLPHPHLITADTWRPPIPRHQQVPLANNNNNNQKNYYGTASQSHLSDSQLSSSTTLSDLHTDSSTPSSPPAPHPHFPHQP